MTYDIPPNVPGKIGVIVEVRYDGELVKTEFPLALPCDQKGNLVYAGPLEDYYHEKVHVTMDGCGFFKVSNDGEHAEPIDHRDPDVGERLLKHGWTITENIGELVPFFKKKKPRKPNHI